MNKYLIKANEHWCNHDVKAAIHSYTRALQSSELQRHESNMANYMLAYLNCLLARRMNQEEGFLGVDLRRPYYDFYLEAARFWMQIDHSTFSASMLALPSVDTTQIAKIEQAWTYLQQLQQVYVASWQVRIKAWCHSYMRIFWSKVQQQMHA